MKFQLTRPRGARQLRVHNRGTGIAFQLTRPRGARLVRNLLFLLCFCISTHAPAWGATLHLVLSSRVPAQTDNFKQIRNVLFTDCS